MKRDEPVERTSAPDRDNTALFSHAEHRRLIGLARRWLGSTAEAEDTVQAVYLRALTETQALSAAWLAVAVRHLSIDRLRRRRHEPMTADDLSWAEAADRGAAQQALQVRDALRHLLARLGAADAALLLLQEVFEFGPIELAALSGLGEAAIRQRLHRSLQRLRDERPAQENAADERMREALFRRCSQAVLARDPSALLQLLRPQETVASATPADTKAVASPHTSRSLLVQADGGFALALSLDGVLLCTVPLGVLPGGEPEREPICG